VLKSNIGQNPKIGLKIVLDKAGYHIELDELIASDYGVL
jgi:hypothetical protein